MSDTDHRAISVVCAECGGARTITEGQKPESCPHCGRMALVWLPGHTDQPAGVDRDTLAPDAHLTALDPGLKGDPGTVTAAIAQVGDEWVATCDHGREVWTLHRATEYRARQSLDVHVREVHGKRAAIEARRRPYEAADALMNDGLQDRVAALREAIETAIRLIECQPRNEFGDQHYLAVEAAYRAAINIVHGALDGTDSQSGGVT